MAKTKPTLDTADLYLMEKYFIKYAYHHVMMEGSYKELMFIAETVVGQSLNEIAVVQKEEPEKRFTRSYVKVRIHSRIADWKKSHYAYENALKKAGWTPGADHGDNDGLEKGDAYDIVFQDDPQPKVMGLYEEIVWNIYADHIKDALEHDPWLKKNKRLAIWRLWIQNKSVDQINALLNIKVDKRTAQRISKYVMDRVKDGGFNSTIATAEVEITEQLEDALTSHGNSIYNKGQWLSQWSKFLHINNLPTVYVVNTTLPGKECDTGMRFSGSAPVEFVSHKNILWDYLSQGLSFDERLILAWKLEMGNSII